MKALNLFVSYLFLLVFALQPIGEAYAKTAKKRDVASVHPSTVEFHGYVHNPHRGKKIVDVLKMIEKFAPKEVGAYFRAEYKDILNQKMPRFRYDDSKYPKLRFQSQNGDLVIFDIYKDSEKNFLKVNNVGISNADMEAVKPLFEKIKQAVNASEQGKKPKSSMHSLLIHEAQAQDWLMPAAIVGAAGLIALGLYFLSRPKVDVNVGGNVNGTVRGTVNGNVTGNVQQTIGLQPGIGTQIGKEVKDAENALKKPGGAR